MVDYKHNVLDSSDPQRPGSKLSSFPSCLLRLLGVTCLSPVCIAPCSRCVSDRTFNAAVAMYEMTGKLDYRPDSQRATVFAAEGTPATFPTRMADGQMDAERFRRILSTASGFGLALTTMHNNTSYISYILQVRRQPCSTTPEYDLLRSVEPSLNRLEPDWSKRDMI